MTMTYGDLRGYGGYFPIAYACAHAREILAGSNNNLPNLLTPPHTSRHVGPPSNISRRAGKAYDRCGGTQGKRIPL